jgi:hypothetical protein
MDDADTAANDRLRGLLLEEPSFEVALAKTQLPPFTPDDREQFTRALVNGFISMDRSMMRPFDGSPGTINIYKVQELIFRFAGQSLPFGKMRRSISILSCVAFRSSTVWSSSRRFMNKR